MREAVLLEPISAEVTDRRTGRPSTATIAFTLSYEGSEKPETVQRVANKITSLFLEENLQVRERQTREISRFLEEEMLKVKNNLTAIDASIARFKKKHINELPELFQVNMQSLNNMEQNTERLNEQLRSLKERASALQIQVTGIISESESKDKGRLDELRLQLVYLKSRFSDYHPDVIKTRTEIKKLEKKVKSSGKSSKTKDKSQDNPVYITLSAQLAGVHTEIDSVTRQIKELENRKEEYRRRIAATPIVEEEYKALAVELNNTQAKYDDLMRKLMEARIAQGLEKEQKGERFTLIDPPRIPEKPFKPNRLAIILIGLVLGIGAGVGTASVREFSDLSVRTAESLSLATSFPVLAEIPEILTKNDLRKRRIFFTNAVIVVIIAAVLFVGVFHFFVMDLNVFWAKAMRVMAHLR